MPPPDLSEAFKTLLNPSTVEKHLVCAVKHSTGDQHPRTGLLHPRFNEDLPRIHELATYLWGECLYYALPRRRQESFRDQVQTDMTAMARATEAARQAFIEFNANYPSRASEVGEVLAYCIVQHQLTAAQIAAKMALKTAGNMPVHGLDGIHARFDDDTITIYFLEAKLAKTAAQGAREYAKSAADFLSDKKQYLREYSIVSDLGNLDALKGDERERALEYFDVMNEPVKRKERFIGVICYSETKHYANKLAVDDGDVDIHQKHLSALLAMDHSKHQLAARQHLEDHGANPRKCMVFYVAVPDVDVLRKEFYRAMGIQTS